MEYKKRAIVSLPSLPAGTDIIGKVGIDQTTPGTTNGVQVNAALPAGSNTLGNVYSLLSIANPTIFNGTYVTDTIGSNIYASTYGVLSTFIHVTAVSGTSPTLKVILQASNTTSGYVDIAESEEITATGDYWIPIHPNNSSNTRYRLEIGGTTPSFTINAIASFGKQPGNMHLAQNPEDRALLMREQGTPTILVGSSIPAGSNNIGKVDIEHSITTISIVNSSTTPLGIDGVFTGTVEDIKDFTSVHVYVFADQDSAIDGLCLQWSCDGTNFDISECFSITANVGRQHEFGVFGRYFRVVYINGGVAQTAFRLSTAYPTARTTERSKPLNKDVSVKDIVPTRRVVIAAQKPGAGDYTNIQCTTAGNLKASIEEFDTSLPAGTNNIGDVDIVTLPALVAGTNTIGKIDLNPLGSCSSGQTTITTAGTAVVLKASTAIKSVTIKALSTNTGLIYVGDSGVSSINGFELEAGDSISLDIDNTEDVYVDASVSGEKVSYLYVT